MKIYWLSHIQIKIPEDTFVNKSSTLTVKQYRNLKREINIDVIRDIKGHLTIHVNTQ